MTKNKQDTPRKMSARERKIWYNGLNRGFQEAMRSIQDAYVQRVSQAAVHKVLGSTNVVMPPDVWPPAPAKKGK